MKKLTKEQFLHLLDDPIKVSDLIEELADKTDIEKIIKDSLMHGIGYMCQDKEGNIKHVPYEDMQKSNEHVIHESPNLFQDSSEGTTHYLDENGNLVCQLTGDELAKWNKHNEDMMNESAEDIRERLRKQLKEYDEYD